MTTAREKALKIIAKQIKELDSKTYMFDVLKEDAAIVDARSCLFSIIERSGYALTKDYKLKDTRKGMVEIREVKTKNK